MMDFLSQLLQGIQHTQPNQQRLMEVGPNGQPRLSSQGNLPAAQQKDTWLEGGQPQPYRAFAGDTSGYQPQQGGAMVYGATIPNGQRFQEDDFTFPRGGDFNRNRDGSISLNGAYVPQGLGLQEDSFNFQPQSNFHMPTQRQAQPQDPIAQLRHFLGL